VIDSNHEGFTGEVIFKHLRQDRPVERIDKARVDCCGQQFECSHRRNRGRLIDDGLLDGIRADGASGDVGKCAFAISLIQAGNQIRHGVIGAFPLAQRPIVLDFHDAKNIRINSGKRR